MAQPELLRLANEAVELTLDQASLRGTIRLAATGDTWMLDIRGSGGWLAEAPAPNHGPLPGLSWG